VLLRCSGQWRIVTGAVVGLDLDAVFSLGQALGYSLAGVAELMPAGEAGMVEAVNERLPGTPVE